MGIWIYVHFYINLKTSFYFQKKKILVTKFSENLFVFKIYRIFHIYKRKYMLIYMNVFRIEMLSLSQNRFTKFIFPSFRHVSIYFIYGFVSVYISIFDFIKI